MAARSRRDRGVQTQTTLAGSPPSRSGSRASASLASLSSAVRRAAAGAAPARHVPPASDMDETAGDGSALTPRQGVRTLDRGVAARRGAGPGALQREAAGAAVADPGALWREAAADGARRTQAQPRDARPLFAALQQQGAGARPQAQWGAQRSAQVQHGGDTEGGEGGDFTGAVRPTLRGRADGADRALARAPMAEAEQPRSALAGPLAVAVAEAQHAALREKRVRRLMRKMVGSLRRAEAQAAMMTAS